MIETMTPEALKDLLESQSNEYEFIDVRSPAEYQDFHLPLTKNIPLDQLPQHIKQLSQERTIITICAKGIRSARASAFLLENGFKTINLEGGLDNWLSAGIQIPK